MALQVGEKAPDFTLVTKTADGPQLVKLSDEIGKSNIVLLFVPMWLGNHVGARHFGRVPPHIWQAMVAIVLGVAAVSAVVRLLN